MKETLGKSAPSVRITSWNCRALFCRDGKRRRRKLDHLGRICERADIVLLQETHGDTYITDLLCNLLAKRFWIKGDFLDRSAAGVITAVSKAFCPTENAFQINMFAPGRVMRSSFCHQMRQLIVWNVHNYGLSEQQLLRISDQLIDDYNSCAAAPTDKITFVLGDFNYERRSSKRLNYATPSNSEKGSHSLRPGQRTFEAALKPYVELCQDFPTHFNARGKHGTNIDRGFCSSPSWLFPSTI